MALTILTCTVLFAAGDDMEAMAAIIQLVVQLALAIAVIAGLWGVFAKAGKPGWAAIIPIYNGWVLAEVAGKPGWWGLLLLIPCVGIIFAIILYIELAKMFGKSGAFAVGLIFLPFIFLPILGFGSAQYGGGSTRDY